MSQTELEARVRRLEDRFAIRELVARYSAAVDDRDVDAIVDCFTRDGAFVGQANRDTRGSEAIRAYYRSRISRFGASFHYPHAFITEFDGDDDAHGVVSAHAEMAIAGEAVWTALRYHDRYRREEGRWRFAERSLRFWYFMKLSELPKGMAEELRVRVDGGLHPAELPESLPTYQRLRDESG